ncbi:hypothetical protein ACQV2X_07960 [Facklamia sp. P12945]|uniref:hypothetical protein n=1 Tax=unclassified Facklamia TaxID=2622293 RepID=UPI003D18497E
MTKLKTVIGMVAGLAGAYAVVNYLYPEKTEEYRKKLSESSVEARDQLASYKELALKKGQELSDVAALASEDAKVSFSETAEELKFSLTNLKNQLFSSIEETQHSLANQNDDSDFKEVLAHSANELKEEIGQSFEEILESFANLKHEIEDTTDIAIELSKEVTGE